MNKEESFNRDSDEESIRLDDNLKELRSIRDNSKNSSKHLELTNKNTISTIRDKNDRYINDDIEDEDEFGKSEILDKRNRSMPKASMVKVMSDTMIKLKKIYN